MVSGVNLDGGPRGGGTVPGRRFSPWTMDALTVFRDAPDERYRVIGYYLQEFVAC